MYPAQWLRESQCSTTKPSWVFNLREATDEHEEDDTGHDTHCLED